MSNLTVFQREIRNFLDGIALRFNEPMSAHTSFRIGGEVEVMAFPKSATELQRILAAAASLGCKPRLLGAGTNILAPDQGLKGLVICLKDCLGGMEQLDETHIRVAAGVTLTRAALFAAKLGLGGMEFAHGIPGSVGGGVYMNAGAYGGELGRICQSVEVMDFSGNIFALSREELDFSYRHSILEEQEFIVLSVVFRLTPGSAEEIREQLKLLQAKRSASQPLDLPSAGSAFKRPAGGYAAALIDQAGLKGHQVGGAAVSRKHAGFVVNLGGATSEDVQALLQQVSAIVLERSGIRLEPEIRIW